MLGSVIDDDEVIVADEELEEEVVVIEPEEMEEKDVIIIEPEEVEEKEIFVIDPVEDANDECDDFEIKADLEVVDDEGVTVTTLLSCSSGGSRIGRGFFATGTSCWMMTRIGIGIGIMSFPFESFVPFANVQVSGTLQVLQDSELLMDVISVSVDQVVE